MSRFASATPDDLGAERRKGSVSDDCGSHFARGAP